MLIDESRYDSIHPPRKERPENAMRRQDVENEHSCGLSENVPASFPDEGIGAPLHERIRTRQTRNELSRTEPQLSPSLVGCYHR